MKRFLVLPTIALFAFLLSCKGGEDNVQVPEGIIPPDSLVYVLTDFHLAEAALAEKKVLQQNTEQYSSLYYALLFKKHNITRTQFDESMEFYSAHPKLYRETYDKVLEELSRLQAEAMQ